jgi:hypothetical protein
MMTTRLTLHVTMTVGQGPVLATGDPFDTRCSACRRVGEPGSARQIIAGSCFMRKGSGQASTTALMTRWLQ